MAQQLKMSTAPKEDQSSVLSICVRWFTAICNSNSKGSKVFWPLQTPAFTCIHRQTNILKKTAVCDGSDLQSQNSEDRSKQIYEFKDSLGYKVRPCRKEREIKLRKIK